MMTDGSVDRDALDRLLRTRPPGSWGLVTDACVDPRTCHIGLGGVLLDPSGAAIDSWSIRSSLLTRDTTAAELDALRQGVARWQERLALLNVDSQQVSLWVGLDCQPALATLHGDHAPSWWHAAHWVAGWCPRRHLGWPNDLARQALGKRPENKQRRETLAWAARPLSSPSSSMAAERLPLPDGSGHRLGFRVSV